MVDWDAAKQVGLIIDSGSGFVFLAFGLWVARLRPRSTMSILFAVFAISFGIERAYVNILDYVERDYTNGALVVMNGLTLIVTASLILLGFHFPRRAVKPKAVWWAMATPMAVVFCFGITYAIIQWDDMVAQTSARGLNPYIGATYTILFDVREAAWAGLVAVLGVRWASLAAVDQRQVAATGAALMLPIAGSAAFGMHALNAPGETVIFDAWGPLLPLLVPYCAFVWLAYARTAVGARHARNVALTGLGWMTIVAILLTLLPAPIEVLQDLGMLGLGRILAVSVFAYAVFHHHLFNIDVKVKFGIRQSTVAAIFVATFFVVSELVASVLSARMGAALGILTTGALVFAIAPLQRFGERVANHAFPGVKPISERDHGERLAMYTDLVEAAWSDGHLTPSEARVLETARSQLGIAAEDVLRIERGVHAQTGTAGPRPGTAA